MYFRGFPPRSSNAQRLGGGHCLPDIKQEIVFKRGMIKAQGLEYLLPVF